MDIRTEDYEKLGSFYLGRGFDVETRKRRDDLVLYDSRDLVTHGVVLGMTGSGKTGLCLAMLEEAAIDGIPAIVIDPKGDIANLLLQFPDLDAASFRPWINEDDARRKGVEPDAFAADQAKRWGEGLAEWGQDAARIARLRDAVEMAIYTPGSSAGLPVSILSSLECPAPEILDDGEVLADRVESTASSLLALLGIDGDPLQSPEHLLLAHLFQHAWQAGEDLDLPTLIQQVQAPPFQKIGVMPLESLFPKKDRMGLAVRLNNLLASPGFSLWLEGDPLDPARLLHTPGGKPRIAIFSIAHLNDAERMFFVSLLLNQMVSWMRTQSGTTSLRAMLYMDEIFGFLPPSKNPPSKKPMMTLLKQARAFGLGTLLATQNPVDLDYKALSNIGTWFLGRLQTERDKMRVLDGLEGSSMGAGFNRADLERMLSGLGSRVFLMNNVHEDGPLTFEVRWVMSYLRGPLTREQIRKLTASQRAEGEKKVGPEDGSAPAAAPVVDEGAAASSAAGTMVKPQVDKRIAEFFLPVPDGLSPEKCVYQPRVIRASETLIEDQKLGVSLTDENCDAAVMDPTRGTVDWAAAEALDIDAETLPRIPASGIAFGELPATLATTRFFTAEKKKLVDHIYREGGVDLLRSPSLGTVSKPGEDERDFRLRLVQAAREVRDERVDALREEYAKKIAREERDVERAEVSLEKEKSQASSAKWSSLASAGSAILGALFGRKKLSATNARRMGTVGRSITRSMDQSSDVGRAEKKLENERDDVVRIEAELTEKIDELKRTMDPLSEKLETVRVKPLKKNITVNAMGIVWTPVPVKDV